MKQRQKVCNGESTPRKLAARLAKMLLQGGCIRHGKTRAIGPKGAMAQPAPLVERFALQSRTYRAEKLLEYRKRELHARLTIRRCGDVELGEMTEVRARGIPVQNLHEKQLDCGHRIEHALPSSIGQTTTSRHDGVGLELACPILLKLFDHLGDRRRHLGSPLRVNEQLTPHTGDRKGRQLVEATAGLTLADQSLYA